MAYATNVPVTRLVFSDGFLYYGAGTTLTVSATVNIHAPSIVHEATGETLVDGQLIPTQAVGDFTVPTITTREWVTDWPRVGGVRVWSYDLVVAIAATGQPTVLWAGTVRPTGGPVVITPGMGTNMTPAAAPTVTEDPDVPGTALIGA